MTKKRMALLAVLPFTVAVIIGVLAMLPPRPGITKANFDRIQDGMTLAEVERIFGPRTRDRDPVHIWIADDESSFAVVGFADGAVDSKIWEDSEETFPDKIRRWFHLPKGT